MSQLGSQLEVILSKLERPIHAILISSANAHQQVDHSQRQGVIESLTLLQQTFATGQNSPPIQWCVRLLATLPLPNQRFADYKELIDYRLADPLVNSLVQLLVVSVKSTYVQPSHLGPQQSQAAIFIESVYNVPPLRWLLYSVLLLTSETSLVHLHIYAAERLFESGNVVLDNAQGLASVETAAKHPVLARILEFLGFFAKVSLENVVTSLCQLFFGHYLDGIINAGKGMDKDSYKRKILAYLISVFHMFPNLLNVCFPKFTALLKDASIFPAILIETVTRFSLFKTSANLVKPVSECSTTWLEFLLKTNLSAQAAELCNLVLILDTVCLESWTSETAVAAVFEQGVVESARILCQVQSYNFVMRVLDWLQDAFLMSAREASAVVPLMASFNGRIEDICARLIQRCEFQQQRISKMSGGPGATGGGSVNRSIGPITHLLLLVELCGLSFGKQACVDAFAKIVAQCPGPRSVIPLDTVPETQDEIGELHSVFIVGYLRIGWGNRDGLQSTYRLGIETVVESHSDATALSNLWCLMQVDENAHFHADTELTTKYTKEAPPSNRLLALTLLQEVLPSVIEANSFNTLMLTDSLVDAYFATLSQYLQKVADPKTVTVDASTLDDFNNRILVLVSLLAAAATSNAVIQSGIAEGVVSRAAVFSLVEPVIEDVKMGEPAAQPEKNGGLKPEQGQKRNHGGMVIASTTARILDSLKSGTDVAADSGSMFLEKKALALNGTGKIHRKVVEKRVDLELWFQYFQKYISFLLQACADCKDEKAVRICFAERLGNYLELRPNDSPPFVSPYLALRMSDQDVISKVKASPILWEFMSAAAKDETAFLLVQDVLRSFCAHLQMVWNRPVTRGTPSFREAVLNSERVVMVICEATKNTYQVQKCVSLFEYIQASDAGLLMGAFYDALTDTRVSKQEWGLRLQVLMKQVVRRNVGELPVDVSVVFLG
ncbi:hypothetical protein HDU81_000840 [Chytriomyces hyalinus]|nr:hypothetical protein HDU81_000840 [Chytriomyces hyalinus]